MDALLANKESIVYGLLGFLIFGWLLAKAPVMIINWCIRQVDTMFAKGDAADDRLLVAFIKWINEKWGPKGEGDNTWPERMNGAAMRIIAWIPLMPVRMFFTAHADKIKELCQKLYDLGIAAAQREIAKHDKPENPPLKPVV